MSTLNEVFARKVENGFLIADKESGESVTRLDGVSGVYPVGSELGCGYEHADGIVLASSDVEKLGIEIE